VTSVYKIDWSILYIQTS